MVVCLMRITSKTRKLIGLSNIIFIGVSILLQTLLVLLKCDKILEFYNIGIFEWLWYQDSLFLYSNFIVSLLLLFSILLLISVFDVAISQESDHFHVDPRSYSHSIYLLVVSFILCVLSYALSLRVSAEYDSKMTKILMANYMNYEKSRSSRRLVDRIHVEYSCCGVKSIDDFVDLSEIDGRLPTQTKLWPCNEWEYCGVPLSCCKSMSCSQRIELLNDGWDPKNTTDNWFNKRGCVEKMDIAFLFFNFPSFILTDFIMILVLGFHMCSMILSQIQVTSSATLHGAHLELSEYSYGWLLDIGQPDPASLMKKLNPDLDEFEMINHVEGNEEMEIVNSDGTVTASENMTDTEITTQLTTEGTDTSESNLNSVGTTKTSSSTSSIMEKQHPNASSDQVYIVDSDAGPPSKELSPKKGNQKKPTKEPKNIKGNQKKKSDRAMKPKGKIQKAKNTNTKKKATTKKNVQQKKPKAKPKKK